jgi:hypothetical protein
VAFGAVAAKGSARSKAVAVYRHLGRAPLHRKQCSPPCCRLPAAALFLGQELHHHVIPDQPMHAAIKM